MLSAVSATLLKDLQSFLVLSAFLLIADVILIFSCLIYPDTIKKGVLLMLKGRNLILCMIPIKVKANKIK